MCPKDAEEMADNVDPDQTAPEEQSDQGLHCLLKNVYVEFYNKAVNRQRYIWDRDSAK